MYKTTLSAIAVLLATYFVAARIIASSGAPDALSPDTREIR